MGTATTHRTVPPLDGADPQSNAIVRYHLRQVFLQRRTRKHGPWSRNPSNEPVLPARSRSCSRPPSVNSAPSAACPIPRRAPSAGRAPGPPATRSSLRLRGSTATAIPLSPRRAIVEAVDRADGMARERERFSAILLSAPPAGPRRSCRSSPAGIVRCTAGNASTPARAAERVTALHTAVRVLAVLFMALARSESPS